MNATVYAFPRTSVRPLREAYRGLVRRLGIDAVVLLDGGTDILMRGDEAGFGTPEEDMTSLAAVAGVDVPVRLVVCLGFGIDAYHGVSLAQVLENLAALDRDGAYLGALATRGASREAKLYLDAVAHAQRHTPARPSIVNGQIAAARITAGTVGRSSARDCFAAPFLLDRGMPPRPAQTAEAVGRSLVWATSCLLNAALG